MRDQFKACDMFRCNAIKPNTTQFQVEMINRSKRKIFRAGQVRHGYPKKTNPTVSWGILPASITIREEI